MSIPFGHDPGPRAVDWDEILATTEDDLLAGRFVFDSTDHPTQEAAWKALEEWLCAVCREVDDEIAGGHPDSAQG